MHCEASAAPAAAREWQIGLQLEQHESFNLLCVETKRFLAANRLNENSEQWPQRRTFSRFSVFTPKPKSQKIPT